MKNRKSRTDDVSHIAHIKKSPSNETIIVYVDVVNKHASNFILNTLCIPISTVYSFKIFFASDSGFQTCSSAERGFNFCAWTLSDGTENLIFPPKCLRTWITWPRLSLEALVGVVVAIAHPRWCQQRNNEANALQNVNFKSSSWKEKLFTEAEQSSVSHPPPVNITFQSLHN